MELFASNHKKGDIFQETKTGKWFVAVEDASYQDADDLEDGWDINPGFGNGMYTVARKATEEEIASHLAAVAKQEAEKRAQALNYAATFSVGQHIRRKGSMSERFATVLDINDAGQLNFTHFGSNKGSNWERAENFEVI